MPPFDEPHEEELTPWDLPEETKVEIIDKISSMASSIQNDWSDPRLECREIWRLCTKLKELN